MRREMGRGREREKERAGMEDGERGGVGRRKIRLGFA